MFSNNLLFTVLRGNVFVSGNSFLTTFWTCLQSHLVNGLEYLCTNNVHVVDKVAPMIPTSIADQTAYFYLCFKWDWGCTLSLWQWFMDTNAAAMIPLGSTEVKWTFYPWQQVLSWHCIHKFLWVPFSQSTSGSTFSDCHLLQSDIAFAS